ncbi:MAG: TadE family protein [Bryobacteraceae bacterium]|jgi:Flp pilus assembly protein TadG
MKSPSVQRRESGNAVLEFTLVAIPLIFLLISIAELSRGMWVYGTLAHAVKEGTRFAAVHGQACAQASSSCPVTVGAVATVVGNAAVGLDPGQISVTMAAGSATQNCAPLSACLTGAGAWPPAPNNGIGLPLKISGTYPFRSALSMFWPGSSPMQLAAITLGAQSQEDIAF